MPNPQRKQEQIGQISQNPRSYQAGAEFGTVISFPVSSVLSANLGWPTVFYFFGGCGLLWFAFWCVLVFNSPRLHPRITPKELSYIESNLILTTTVDLPKPPYKSIFTCVPFLALMVSHMGQSWGYYTLLTEIPTYLQDIQHFSLQSVSA